MSDLLLTFFLDISLLQEDFVCCCVMCLLVLLFPLLTMQVVDCTHYIPLEILVWTLK
jgi:hypothetical protein